MPTYEYVCRSCGEPLEAVQAFTDDALTTCPNCGGVLRKVFGNVGIVFKGSGFYKTDSRSSTSAAKPANGGEHEGAAAATTTNDTKSGDAAKSPATSGSGSGSETTSTSTPAPAASTTSGSSVATAP
jgi:putative FmdB family regulatory protein